MTAQRRPMIALTFAAATAVVVWPANSPASPDIARPTAVATVATQLASLPATGRLSVLTYNVKGLPWPIASGRQPALAEIGDTLAKLRVQGQAPQVVVLQEAFTPEARAIAARAGYRYAVYGPGSEAIQPIGKPRSRDMLKGEGFGPMLPSGLVMMSDYKISGVRRTPFPAGTCAGFDCLANKGMLAARIDVPGVPAPVEIVTAHFNSQSGSGQPEPATREVYEAQIDAMDRFVDENKWKRTVRIFAGDFNVGHSPARLTALVGYIRHRKIKLATAVGKDKYEGLCLDRPDSCRRDMALAANVPLEHANDWQFYQAPGDVHLNPVARQIMFGRNRTGKMLSDHFGLNVVYQFD